MPGDLVLEPGEEVQQRVMPIESITQSSHFVQGDRFLPSEDQLQLLKITRPHLEDGNPAENTIIKEAANNDLSSM